MAAEKKNASMTVRLPDRTKAALQSHATAAGMELSDFVRQTLEAAARARAGCTADAKRYTSDRNCS